MSRLKCLDERAWENLNPSPYCTQWHEQTKCDYPIIAPAVSRQLQTAKEILKRLTGGQKGVLLADDVGLGKTAVAAIVAQIYACKGRKVVVLAPNQLVADKWKNELKTHKSVLDKVAPQLHMTKAKDIRVRTHHKASKRMSRCDLLIVDEAHRSKGEGSRFRKKLRNQNDKIKHILCLTATPFSIDPREFGDVLDLIGVRNAIVQVAKSYSERSEQYWSDKGPRPAKDLAKKLVAEQKVVLKKLKKFVIRHSVDNLQKRETKFYGEVRDSKAESITHASPETIRVLLQADRLFELDKQAFEVDKQAGAQQHMTNDPRFHVSWGHLKDSLDKRMAGDSNEEARHHEQELRKFLRNNQLNPKAIEVARQVRDLVGKSNGHDYKEKVLVFCHHYSSAREIEKGINREFGRHRCLSDEKLWGKAWANIMAANDGGNLDEKTTFVKWLSSANLRSQTAAWLPMVPTGVKELIKLLSETPARKHGETISDEAKALFQNIKGANFQGLSKRVFCQGEGPVNKNTLEVFKSPFGPDVLVATDKLSEGVDLHYCCRHLVHYELSPSPMRTIQRRGRLRRLGNWASRSKLPLEVRYPYLPGTRDEKLVAIMKGRLDLFDLMLGGVGSEIKMDGSSDREKELTESLKREKAKNRPSQVLAVVKNVKCRPRNSAARLQTIELHANRLSAPICNTALSSTR